MMSEMFESIMHSFDETVLSARQGRLRETVFVSPVKEYDAAGIRELRKRLDMTQAMFAGLFAVSKKTVEAWEAGRNTPNGPSLRMMELLSEDLSVADHFVSRKGVRTGVDS